MNQEAESGLKILIADDSNSDRILLKAIVQNQGHQPLLAADGLEAVALFQQEKPDIILLDALMPNMDGFDTARFVKANSGDDFVPIIFLTSLNEADSLARCLEAGGDDFLTKPYNSVILKAKINAFWRMLKMHVTLQAQRDQIAENNMRLINEQEVAKRTFDKIAHEGALHLSNIQYQMSPLAVFNGDVLLAALRPNGNLCVLLGDFTGHGLAAAIGAMPLSQTFYSMVAKGFTVKDVVYELNLKLKDILPVGVFCCATMIDVDFSGKSLEIWCGGMPENYFYEAETGQKKAIASQHLALGILSAEKFKATTHIQMMQNGDRFFMWSDGIIEAENAAGEMYGESRLEQVFIDNGDAVDLFADVNTSVANFIGATEPSDDISIAEIMMVDHIEKHDSPHKAVKNAAMAAMDWCYSYEIRPQTIRNSDPMPILQKVLMDIPGLRPRSGELFTVLSELYANALEHGVLKLDSSMKKTPQGFTDFYQQRAVRLEELNEGFIRFDLDYRGDDQQGELLMRVTDSGDGFDFASHRQKSSDKNCYSGRGLHLISSICKSVSYIGVGNQVEVVFDWHNVPNEDVN
ncbi:MAG: fused response regulator/phosphatase [Pseudomonadales bacterium]|nr:fused response regulator/phosphatase [Pseudomonadales bacterium]